MSLFRGKVAYVTGGGSGLGLAFCEELALKGAISVVTDINKEAAGRVGDAIIAAGGRSCAMELDVSQPARVTESIDRIVGTYGWLDYMFNNAGIIILSEVRDRRFASPSLGWRVRLLKACYAPRSPGLG